MSQKVEADTDCAAFEEPTLAGCQYQSWKGGKDGRDRVEEGKHGICVCMRDNVL